MSEAGRRFSLAYGQRGLPAQDSIKARRRLLATFLVLWTEVKDKDEIAALIRREIGTYNPANWRAEYWTAFFMKEEAIDVIDAVTVIYTYSVVSYKVEPVAEWLKQVARIFAEENLSYVVDIEGGVHYRTDQEIETSRSATVAGLDLQRYYAARDAFENAHFALGNKSPDTLGAVRLGFDAVENVFKLMTGESRIGPSEITRKLGPRLAQTYTGRALDAAKLASKAMGEWVNACHQYRHAPREEEPSPPPIGIALVLVSSAAAHLRWLVELDQTTL